MILVFHPTTKEYLFNTGKNSLNKGDNQEQLNNNKADYMATSGLSEEEWGNKIEVIVRDDSAEAKDIMKGYIPSLTQAGKLSKTFTKSEHLLAKEAKMAKKESNKARITEIDNELKREKTTEEKLALLIEKVDKMTK